MSACIIADQLRTVEWDAPWGGIPNEPITDADRNEVFGLAICSVPVGSAAFVKAHLAKKRKRILCDFVMIDPLLNPGRWPHPDVPARQMLRILALACLQLMDDYWIRYIHPDYTLKFAESIDVQRLFQMCLGADTHSWSEHTQDHQGGGMAPPSCHHRGHLAVIDDNGGGDALVVVITILILMLCGREEEAGENTGGGAGGGRPRQPGRRVQHSIVHRPIQAV